MVQVRHLSKQVASPGGSLLILDDISLTVPTGATAAIVGASGSGKSTLLGLMAGLDTPSSGTIAVAGTDLSALDEEGRARLRAGRVGFVFQAFHLLPALTALENVLLPLELSGHTNAMARAREVMTQVGLDDRLHHYPTQLSGGEQQRVAIARAFVTEPEILFADEPTGNLDQHTGERVIELLFRLNTAHHTTLVLVTHDDALARHCSLRFELEAGRLRSAA
jgi:putative ABC transport system ATP-binding protein